VPEREKPIRGEGVNKVKNGANRGKPGKNSIELPQQENLRGGQAQESRAKGNYYIFTSHSKAEADGSKGMGGREGKSEER